MDLSANQTKLHAALPTDEDRPATPAQLATDTGLGYSTVTRLLRELAEAGFAVKDGTGWRATGPARHPDPHGGAADPDPTAAADTDSAPNPPADPGPEHGVPGALSDETDDPSTGDAHTDPDAPPQPADDPDGADHRGGGESAPPDADSDAAPRQRLRKGELPKQVLAMLRDRGGEGLSPHRLTKLIGARSSGAVGNACDALVKAGLAELAAERPRSYRATAVD